MRVEQIFLKMYKNANFNQYLNFNGKNTFLKVACLRIAWLKGLTKVILSTTKSKLTVKKSCTNICNR